MMAPLPRSAISGATTAVKKNGAYLAGLRLLEGLAGDVDVFVPGHGSIGGADQVRALIDQDRAYVHGLREAE